LNISNANRQNELSVKIVNNILYQTECTKRGNRLKGGESSRSIVNDKSGNMKRILKHLGRVSNFRYIADNTTQCMEALNLKLPFQRVKVCNTIGKFSGGGLAYD